MEASLFADIWLKFTGKDRWTPLTARVLGVSFAANPEGGWNSDVGDHRVTYIYIVNGEYQSGHFSYFGQEGLRLFKSEDRIEIRYNPRKPSRSYFPDSSDSELNWRRDFHKTAALIGAGCGLVVLVVTLLMKLLNGH